MAKKYNKINGNLVVDTPKVVTFSTYAAAYQGCLDEDVPQDCLVVVENDSLYIWDGDQVTLTKLTEVGGGGIQPKYVVGDIMQLYGTTAPSGKWLKCDGSAFDTTRYADLYNLLGSGNTPDLNGYVLKGIGSNGNLSTHDPITLGAKLSANIGNHIHGYQLATSHSHTYSDEHSHAWNSTTSGVTNGIGYLINSSDTTYVSQSYATNRIAFTGQNLADFGIDGTLNMMCLGHATFNINGTSTYYDQQIDAYTYQYSKGYTRYWKWCNTFSNLGDLDSYQDSGNSASTGTSGKVFDVRAMEVTYFIRAEV